MTLRLPSRNSQVRAFAGVGVGAITATMLSGCFYLSPAQTDVSYNPADGAIAKLGDLDFNNVLIVSSGKGAQGAVQGLVVNNGDTTANVKVKPDGGSEETIDVPAHTAVRLDGKTSGDDKATVNAITIQSTPVAPGRRTTIQFSTAGGGTVPVSVPVLLDQRPYGSASPSHPSN